MEQDNKLHLPDDFRQACQMFSLSLQEALEFFISRNTFYFALVRSPDLSFSMASDVFQEYVNSRGEIGRIENEYCRTICAEYAKEVVALTMMPITNGEKLMVYEDLINEWYEKLEPILIFKGISTTCGLKVSITKDFYILCEIFRTTPLEVLRYYVNHVSVFGFINSSKKTKFTYATDFFLLHPSIVVQEQAN